jgi:phage-related protein
MGEINNFLIFAGKSTKDFNVHISGVGVFDAPDRDVTTVAVPGRNGDLVLDNGRFKNISVTYPAFIPEDFPKHIAAFRAFLKSVTGYQRLEDSYYPEYFCKAMVVGGFDPETSPWNRAGSFEITFNRKPQRWLKAGESFLAPITGQETIYNPTVFPAKPLIRVRGTGTFGIGGVSVEILENPTYIDIDCDLQDCYNGLTNLNSDVVLLSGVFPTLAPGTTGINVGEVTSLEIMPRWWTL